MTTMGATVAQATYTNATSLWNAAQIFDGYLGATWSETFQKVFWTEGEQAPAALTDIKGASLVANGCQLLVCVKPKRATSIAEYANLQAILNLYIAAGAIFDACLWHEPDNGGAAGAFATPAAYQAYVNYYIGAVRGLGLKNVYDASMLVEANALAYYPGDAVVDKIGCDYYCRSFVKNGSTLASMIALAFNHAAGPVPFSVYEFGFSADKNVPTLNVFLGWIYNQVQLPLVAYQNNGGTVERCCWYGVFDNWNFIGAGTPASQLNAMLTLGNAITGGPNPGGLPPLPDYPDYNTPQANADAISTTGAPLLVMSDLVLANSAYTVPANGSFTLPPMLLNQPAIDVQISAAIGAAATVPFLQAELIWQDSNSGLQVDAEHWGVACGLTGAANTINGRELTKGDQLVVKLVNLDPAVPVAATVLIIANSRVYPRDRIWQATSNNPPGYTYIGGHPGYQLLGNLSAVNVNAATTKQWLFPTYQGDVQLWIDQNGVAAASFLATLQPAPVSVLGTAAMWAGAPAGGPATGIPVRLSFTRAPMLLTLANTGGGAATVNVRAASVD